MNFKAAKTSALLCLLFMVVYGTLNWLTAFRHDVGTLYFRWERHIPFVPLMIVPYMSIDLFFIAAPFVCRSDRQRRTLSNRIVAAILIAGACFLLFPLRFAFPRPHVDGMLGLIFDHFRSLDQPFNQFPSLHIALQIILLSVYAAHTRGLARLAIRVWFLLIGLSTLLTFQHHVIDVIGGLALGMLSVHVFRDEPLHSPANRNARVGVYYFLGAVSFAGLSVKFEPWGWVLLWPVLSMTILATAYFHFGARIFRKRLGCLPVLTQVLLWPILLAQRVSLAYYARQSNPWDVLTDRLWIGRRLSAAEARHAIGLGVTSVLDLTGEFSEARPFLSIDYHQLPILDLTAPTFDQMQEALSFIRTGVERGIVYVHCKAGYSRTAAVAGAYLLAADKAGSVDEAIAMLRSARPRIVIRPEAMQSLNEFYLAVSACTSLEEDHTFIRNRRRSIAQIAASVSKSLAT